MSSSASEGLLFFALVINGGLAGAIYALIALAFVLVYKASRMINFALGEWIMFGSLLASTGSHTIGLDLGGAVAVRLRRNGSARRRVQCNRARPPGHATSDLADNGDA